MNNLLKNEKLLRLLSPYADKTKNESCIIEEEENNFIYFKEAETIYETFRDALNYVGVIGNIGTTTIIKFIEGEKNKKLLEWGKQRGREYQNVSIIYSNGEIIEHTGEGNPDELLFTIRDDELYLYTVKELEKLYNNLVKVQKGEI